MTIKIDYKKELETASKGMIMIHDHVFLIKLLVRMIVRKAKLRHAGMILFEPTLESYVLAVSRGETGDRIPEGFLRFEKNHPIIRIFHQKEYKYLIDSRNALVFDDIDRMIWHESVLGSANGSREILRDVSEQMPMLNSVACVPAFYRHQLLAVLLLGAKHDGTRLEQDELDFFSALASDVAMAIRNAQLFEGLQQEAAHSRNLFIQTTIAFGSFIEAKDSYTHGHTERVTKYAQKIARRMAANGTLNVTEKFFENLHIASLLHDIGKIGIPESILAKKNNLTSDEYEVMKTHAARGADILATLPDFKGCIDGVRHHHEKFDGSGYPDALKGNDIPMISAIIAVADTFDAMTTDRPYRIGLSREYAIEEIERYAGVWYHPAPVTAITELFQEGDI
ncbi:MAG: HD domain-containing phosphohydrolase [Candidatus Omnitrophota bacterium]